MAARRIFDESHYELLDRSRGEVASRLLAEVKVPLGIQTVLDVGCGLGYFSRLLKELDFKVTAIDGRIGNLEEAQKRSPGIQFFEFDAQDPGMKSFGKFDLVFCFGLLYHMENPLMAIRHLRAMTNTILFVESVIFPGEEPILALIDESSYEDQGLSHLAFYPTEPCLIKMLYRAGFACVYEFLRQPDHPDYREMPGSRRARTMLVASFAPVGSKELALMVEPSSAVRPWDRQSGVAPAGVVQRLKRFVTKLLPETIRSIRSKMKLD